MSPERAEPRRHPRPDHRAGGRGGRGGRRAGLGALVVAALVASACSADDDAEPGTTTPTADAADAAEPAAATTSTTGPAPATSTEGGTAGTDGDDGREQFTPATFTVRPGVEQIAVLDAQPGHALQLRTAEGTVLAEGAADDAGSWLVRDLEAGVEHLVLDVDAATTSDVVVPQGRDEHPAASFYAEQRLPAPGFGYLEVRDGTTLSVNVALPGPPDAGPYPTVVEYSGYTPSDPDETGFADLFNALGYAYVGVNVRGTGCSGGSYRFFEYAQNLDGYDVVETVAAQPWVLGNRVGMVGVSYPGISQLFVAQTQPPSLAAITPFSVLDDSYRSTAYPGGLLNTGFALEWIGDRVADAEPEGQEWAAARIAAGDEECAANQRLRLQNPDLPAELVAAPYYDPELADELAPWRFVDRITVPTFIAGAWQDEQTGGRFPTMLDRFTGTDHLYASLTNGLHIDSIGGGIFPRYVEFLDLYVAQRTPSFTGAAAVVPFLAAALFGTEGLAFPPERFAGMAHEEALAAFEAEPPIQVLFENGAADGVAPLTPLPRFVESFDAWPIPTLEPTPWYLDDDGSLTEVAPGDTATAEYLALPDGIPATFYEGDSSALWRSTVVWDWQEPAPGTAASFLSPPLDETLVMAGSASADLYLASNLGDTDVEVTLSEVRPDGQEVYVQSGWLRASQRALDEAASTELRPAHTHLEADAEPLPDGSTDELALTRVEIFPFAHVFRADSQIRLAVDAPGGNRAVWEFDTIAGGEQVSIGTGGDSASRVVLPVVPGVEVPADAPACESLRGQPCRESAP